VSGNDEHLLSKELCDLRNDKALKIFNNDIEMEEFLGIATRDLIPVNKVFHNTFTAIVIAGGEKEFFRLSAIVEFKKLNPIDMFLTKMRNDIRVFIARYKNDRWMVLAPVSLRAALDDGNLKELIITDGDD
jgi:hypothetical protein